MSIDCEIDTFNIKETNSQGNPTTILMYSRTHLIYEMQLIYDSTGTRIINIQVTEKVGLTSRPGLTSFLAAIINQVNVTAVISGTVDVADRAGRLLGIIANLLNPHPVSLTSLPNPSNLDVALSTRLKISDFALTQELGKVGLILTTGGAIIDPRSIRTLTSADIVSAIKSGTWNIDNLLNPHPVSLASIPNPSNLDVLLSSRFKPGDTIGNTAFIANAGSNLNTSLLALEAGGNLAAILAKLDVALSTRALETGGNLAAILAQLDSKTSTLFKTGQNIGNTGFNVNNFPASIKILDTAGSNLLVIDSSGRITVLSTPTQTTRTSLTVKPEREDVTSSAFIISPSAAGVKLIAGVSGQKIKVYLWGYHATVDGQHFFYFGTSTTAPTLGTTEAKKVFGVHLKAGPYRQTEPNPHVSAATDDLYFYSANAESSMSVDFEYVQE